jgi:hypothetical protein
MTTISSPPRPRWYPITVAILVLAIAILITVALLGLVDDGGLADGALGFFTGLFAVLGVGLVAVTEIGRRTDAQLRDAASLDDLEPLRAAVSSYGSDRQTTPTSDDRRR